MKRLYDILIEQLAIVYARIKWGRQAYAWRTASTKVVAAVCNPVSVPGIRGPSFSAITPWGIGRTWCEAFKNARGTQLQ